MGILFSRDTLVSLFCSFSILFLGLFLHWIHHYPFSWPEIGRFLTLVLVGIGIFLAGKLGDYPSWCSLGWTLGLIFWLVACSVVTLHVLPLTPFPWIDKFLAHIDQELFFSTANFSMWMRGQYPLINNLLSGFYCFFPYETFLCFLVLPLFNPNRSRELVFLISFAGFLGFFIYFFFPAIGPMAIEHYVLSAQEADLFKNIVLLRELKSLPNYFLEGSISFPSYHTIWALIFAWVWRDHKWIFWPLVLINMLIIISTLSTGWHYLSDVLGGGLIFLIAVMAERRVHVTHRPH